MCKNSYEKFSERTKKNMLFCKLLGTDGLLSQICISQRFCKEKDKYIESENSKKNCINYIP